MLNIATLYYQTALQVADEIGPLPPRMKKIWDMYSLEKAAAFNLCIILKASGAAHMAYAIRKRYLLFSEWIVCLNNPLCEANEAFRHLFFADSWSHGSSTTIWIVTYCSRSRLHLLHHDCFKTSLSIDRHVAWVDKGCIGYNSVDYSRESCRYFFQESCTQSGTSLR